MLKRVAVLSSLHFLLPQFITSVFAVTPLSHYNTINKQLEFIVGELADMKNRPNVLGVLRDITLHQGEKEGEEGEDRGQETDQRGEKKRTAKIRGFYSESVTLSHPKTTQSMGENDSEK